jgi:glycosyltransferase involved in cell wall biosynthesis
MPDSFKSWDIRVSRIQKIPVISNISKLFTFFYPFVFESMNLREYDVVISSTASFAKGVITKPNQLHICYCHTVPRFLYGYPSEISRRNIWFLKPLLAVLDLFLRAWDYSAAQRVEEFVVNSDEVGRRVAKFYRKAATIIYPPIDLKKFKIGSYLKGAEYYLVVSRLSAYKNIDLAILACLKLNEKLKIVGVGREEERLRKLAQGKVEFLGWVDDDQLANYYREAKAVLFPGEDDFGIVPVEAAACGKPVIALAAGGALETIIQHTTGEFFTKPTVESLVGVLEHFDPAKYKPENCRKQAEKFSKERFVMDFANFVEKKWKEKKNAGIA